MLIIGSHVHFNSNQLLGAVKEAISYDANAFMLYTGAPQNTIRMPINDYLTIEAYNLMKSNNIFLENVICHAPYLINLANSDSEKREFSIKFLRKEIERCLLLGIKYIVLHPGNALNSDRRIALINISESLNKVLLREDNIMILLETMAGKGTECGVNINELKTIINGVELNDKIGVCIDTCHLNDFGVSMSNFDQYLDTFENSIGLNKIKCVHINDSKNILGSHKDRHENIGFGTIGFDNLMYIIYHDKLKSVPKILETPYLEDKSPYKQEIVMIKSQIFNPNLQNDIINN